MNPNTLRYALIALFLAAAGCAKKEAAPPVPTAAASESVALVAKPEQSAHFAAVNRHLELGGTVYGYFDIDGDLLHAAAQIQQTLQQVAKSDPDMAKVANQDFAALFKIAGLDDVKAIGLSSIKEADGYYRNRTFFYTPQGRHGLLAALGGPVEPFRHLDLAPADTDAYVEGEVDVGALYSTVKEIADKVSGPGTSTRLDTAIKQAGQQAAISLLDLIYGLKGRSAAVVRFDKDAVLALPFPGAVKLPKFSVLICVEGIGPILEPMLARTPAFRRTDEGTAHVYTLAVPLPVPDVAPVLVVDGTTLYFATHEKFLRECRQHATSLADRAEFKTALDKAGKEGNGLVYLSPHFFTRLRDLETINADAPPALKDTLHSLVSSIEVPTEGRVSVRTNLPDGILAVSHWNQSAKSSLAAAPIAAVGLMAAMAIPAFQKVRTASQEKAVLNNLRMLSAAADQYYLENGKAEATLDDLVGPDKFIKVLQPVAGEDYSTLVFKQGEALSVQLSDGRTITYNP
jgi:type IV pilus assembly protein PilA